MTHLKRKGNEGRKERREGEGERERERERVTNVGQEWKPN